MLDNRKGFVPLPREKIIFTSPPRTALSLQTPNSYPGKEPFSLQSATGTAFLTNQRIVYLPATSTPQLQSFATPILNLQDAHVTAPFFGPNVWTGVLLPVIGGGIPPQHAYLEIKLTFKDGGAFDFHSNFERVKETLAHAVEIARESGAVTGQPQNLDLSNVHLEQLPAYEEVGGPVQVLQIQRPIPISPTNGRQHLPDNFAVPVQAPNPQQLPTPDEPPPGYEEAQQSSVVNSLEEHVRRQGTS
ncbi:MAG: hypothetical protein MMC33_006561 [Icmadophila ericetorum]|nr:hypothetical protein [Icmadophila ericetorum]